MKRYAIWDKKSPIYTPSGRMFSAEEWMNNYPISRLDTVDVVCSYGEINGGIFSTLNELVRKAEASGCTFTDGMTAEEKLTVIEAFEDAKVAEATAKAAEKAEAEALNAELSATSLASIAAQLEFQNMMMLEDVEV